MRIERKYLRHLCEGIAAVSLFCCLVIAAVPASAVEDQEQLLLGIEPEHNIFDQMERYRILADYMSDLLNIKVKLTIMSRYGEVINRFKVLHLDGAFLSSYTAAKGIRDLGLEPVVSPVYLDGESTSQGYIFVRKDSGIEDVKGMKGKSVAFVDPATTEGYLFPLVYFYQHGVTEMEGFFSGYFFTGSHASTIFAVLDGRADIGSVKNTVFDKQVRQDPSIGEELKIIAMSPKISEVTLCIRSDLPARLQHQLQAVLLNMDATSRGRSVLERFEAIRFIRSGKDNFSLIDGMVETVEVFTATDEK